MPFLRTAALSAFFITLLLGSSIAEAAPYDNTSPVATKCSVSAKTVSSANIFYRVGGRPIGQAIGRVELRYSPTCRTAWARTVNNNPKCFVANPPYTCSYASVTRNSDRYTLGRYGNSGISTIFTNQVNDAGVTSYAYGCTRYAGVWNCTRTSSYR